MRLFTLILLFLALVSSSCTIEKMRYSKGYHVEWISNKKHVSGIPKKPKRTPANLIVKNNENTEIIDSNNLTIKEIIIEDSSSHETVQISPEKKHVFHQNFKRKTTDYHGTHVAEKKQRKSIQNIKGRFRKTEMHPILEGLFYFFIVGPAISVAGVFAILFAQMPIAILLFILGGIVSIYGLVLILSFLIDELFA